MSIKKHVDLDTLANAVEAIPSNIFLKDTELKYVFSSHIWEQVDNNNDADFDIYGKTDRDIRKDTSNLDNVEKTDHEIIRTGVGTRYTIKSEIDGHVQYLELIKEPVKDNDGNVIGIVGLINDVTGVTEEIRDMLENEKAYREAMKAGAHLAYNVNLTRDVVEEDLLEMINGKEVNLLEAVGMEAPCSYSAMLQNYAKVLLNGPCQQEYLEFHNPQRLIELFYKGQREVTKEIYLNVNGIDGNVVEVWSYITILLLQNTRGEIVAFITVNDTTEQRKKEEEIRRQLEENVKEAERVANMKSDFLANMSHEIRTPMNAVIGMAEMALREELPDAAREYINQIKSSGNALLNIINDILDFSKIESGKMDIVNDEFEPLSNIHDISSVMMNRISGKDLEFVATINPCLPRGLYGDIMRIRQVIINLANNAIKFTKQGYVQTDVDFEKISEDEIMIKIAIMDTGIGIKEEDIDKLFVSFQQVDSKRNRNIEGTGLGLAISSTLVKLMGGTIRVVSEYEKGSTFSFEIPQKVTDWTPICQVKEKQEKMIVGYWDDCQIEELLFQIFDTLEIENYSYKQISVGEEEHFDYPHNKKVYFFTNQRLYREELASYIDIHPEIQFVVLCDSVIGKEDSRGNVLFIKKPLSTVGIAMALNNELFHVMGEGAMEFEFIAPEAKVLIVDDNEVNLAVADGLLAPLEMQVATCLSGKKALELLENETFDIVFMDHMMPEIDGVETTKIIRSRHPELAKMPIIALSANAVENAKKMFLSEGMDDFIAKPIEIRTITNKIRQWLPADKIIKAANTTNCLPENQIVEDKLVIGDLDIDAAVALMGSQKIYLSILEKYACAIKSKADVIKKCEVAEDIKKYTIEVHALKSSSKQIGAMELSDMAAELEKCGNAEDIATIHEKTDRLLEKYLGYYDIFNEYFGLEKQVDGDRPEINPEQLMGYLDKILNAIEELDMDVMETVSEELDHYHYEGEPAKLNERLKVAVTNLDIEAMETIITEWKAILSQ